MLKMLYRKLNKNKDYRFLDAETYRKHSKAVREDGPMFQLSEKAALNVDFCSATDSASLADIQYFRNRLNFSNTDTTVEQDYITVDMSPEKQGSPDFSYKPQLSRSNVFEINDIDYISQDTVPASEEAVFNEEPNEEPFVIEESLVNEELSRPLLSLVSTVNFATPRLGVFSDSKAYSAFVKSELAKLEVDIQHFNHPRTLNAVHYPHFDTIDAWIVFLSDESEDNFLDQFIDRYIDKPTLFLVPKSSRKTTVKTIRTFVKELI